MTRRVALVTPSGALVALAILLSARAGGTPAATEPPASTLPPSSVPAPSSTVEPTTSTSTAPTTTPEPGGDGDASTPPGLWVPCETPWGDIEPAWCSPQVQTWIRQNPDTGDIECWVTPAGEAAGRTTCTAEEDTDVLPETAAGSRWT